MKKQLVLSIVATAALMAAGCATQGTTDNGSGTSVSTMSTTGTGAGNSCKGMSSCKQVKTTTVSKTTVNKTDSK